MSDFQDLAEEIMNPTHRLTFKREEVKLLDITKPEFSVEIQIRDDGEVVWIHVDGITVLRVCQIPQITIRDERD